MTLPQELTILEFFEFARYGTIDLGTERQYHADRDLRRPVRPRRSHWPRRTLADRITLDDGRAEENPDPAIHPEWRRVRARPTRSAAATSLTNVTGVLDYRFDGPSGPADSVRWRVQPTEGADYTAVNLRSATPVPEVGGTTKVASFNVLNYFTTLELARRERPGGVRSPGGEDRLGDRRDRRRHRRASSRSRTTATPRSARSSTALNERHRATVPTTSSPRACSAPTSSRRRSSTSPPRWRRSVSTRCSTRAVDPRFNTDLNRPALAQTFTDLEAGGEVTVVVNHLKSKGSDVHASATPTPATVRATATSRARSAAEALADWLAADPTGQGAGNELIIGDLNSYDKEDPIDALRAAGYTDLVLRVPG